MKRAIFAALIVLASSFGIALAEDPYSLNPNSRVPYVGATQDVDLNGKNLNNVVSTRGGATQSWASNSGISPKAASFTVTVLQ